MKLHASKEYLNASLGSQHKQATFDGHHPHRRNVLTGQMNSNQGFSYYKHES
jgi:hypothetical protein